VSFGPRWTATSAAQNEQCLACHEDNVAKHWQDALHMINNLTCVTCHDIHAEQDKVLFANQQAEVCTVCHKTQKKGIHGLQQHATDNPPCSQCHNPHDHESAQTQMLLNHSAGCNDCHDLVKMASSTTVSDKAKSYHKVMARPGRTCLNCHQGIAHAPAEATTAMHTTPMHTRKVTLFYPGMADSDWLLQSHPGSQPLRQGANCQQCHRGDEAAMGQSRSINFQPASRDVQVSFAERDDQLQVTVQWRGPEDDATLALMWGNGNDESFRRGGCFAACHSDMPGMSRDRGQQNQKYLWSSRLQQQRIGSPAIPKESTALKQLMTEGAFVELWRVELASGTVTRAHVLDDVHWQTDSMIWINKTYTDGQWKVTLRRKMGDTKQGMGFTREGKYTLGIALNGDNNPKGKHWVSLPLTLSLSDDDTDFTVE
jgi:predicted CXXCH cytochrome family protein